MTEPISATLATYDANVDRYMAATAQKTDGEQKLWIDEILNSIPKSASILEIGSAFGRDASYIQGLGYSLDLTDGSVGFVNYLNKHGFTAQVLDIVKEAPTKHYDLVLACAVFLHFPLDEFRQALDNVRQGLSSEGKFAFSVKNGDGEEWTDAKMGAPRYFKYWREASLRHELGRAGYVTTSLKLLTDDKWIHVVAEQAE